MLSKDSPISEIEAETERLKKLLSDNGYKVSKFVPATLEVDFGCIILGFKPKSALRFSLRQEAIMNRPEWKRFRAHIFERAVSLFQTALLAGVLTVLCLILSRI